MENCGGFCEEVIVRGEVREPPEPGLDDHARFVLNLLKDENHRVYGKIWLD